MRTWFVEADTVDHEAVRDALFALDAAKDTRVHLGSIVAYTDGITIIQHWCDEAAARDTASRLTQAGLTARAKPDPGT